MRYRFSSRRGFSLVTAVISIVLMGLSIVAFMRLSEQQFKGARHVSSLGEWAQVSGNLTTLFNSKSSCANAFWNNTNLAKLNPSSTPPATINHIKMAGTASLLKIGDRLGEFTLASLDMTIMSGPTALPSATPPQNEYLVKLDVVLSRAADSVGGHGDKKTSYLMNLFTTLGSGAQDILTCSATGALGNDAQSNCLSIVGGVWDAPSEKCRITIENRTSDPASPSPGQLWLRTDL